jgi:hypothetical protein
MATTPIEDDFDMPDLTDEMLLEFKPLTELAHTDLHMGAAQVKPVSKPKAEPVDLVGIIANAVVGAGYLSAVWLFVQVWAWVLSS